MDIFLMILKKRLATYEIEFYGNGSNSLLCIVGNCYEGWPYTWCGVNSPNRNAYTMLEAEYGIKWYNQNYKKPPLYIPASKTGKDLPADNVAPQLVTFCAGFAQAFTPGATVFDNSGKILEIKNHVRKEELEEKRREVRRRRI